MSKRRSFVWIPVVRALVLGCLVVGVFGALSGCSALRAKQPAPGAAETAASCPTAREYITTLEFLRAEKEFAYPEKDSQALAFRVAGGCEGAAARFIRVAKLLSTSGLGGNDAVSTALELALKSDRETDTFVEVFRTSFLAEYLDMDLGSALSLARSLSTDFQGDKELVRKDYRNFVNFCVSASSLDLPRPKCAQLSATLAKAGEKTMTSVFQGFVDTYKFLRSESGPGLQLSESLELAEELIGHSRSAPESFIQAYRYGVSSKGLGLGVKEALSFARRMAAATAQKASETKTPGAALPVTGSTIMAGSALTEAIGP